MRSNNENNNNNRKKNDDDDEKESQVSISPLEMSERDIYPLLFVGAGRCALTTLTHFPENRQRASLVVDAFGGWLESWADRAMRLGMTHARYPITQTPFASSSMAIQSFSSRMGRNEELAYSGSDKFAPLPSTRLYAEACAMKIRSDEDGGILKSVPIVKDEVTSLRKIEANEEYPGLLKRGGGILAKTKGGKEFIAAQAVVCCAKKEAVMPEKLKAFMSKESGGYGRVKTSESINVLDPEGTLSGKRLLVVGGGMTAASVACGAVENSKVKSVTLLHRKNFKRREFDVEPEYFGAKGLRPFHNSEDFEYRAKFIDDAKGRGTINGVTWKRVRSHSVTSKAAATAQRKNSPPKLCVVEKAEIVSIGFDENTKKFSTTIELTDVAKRELAAKRARSIIEVDADDDFQALTMTVEEASYETPKVEHFDEIWVCCGTVVSAETDPLLSSLPKTNYFNGYPQLVETSLVWEHGPNEVSLAKERGGCRWPKCSVFVSGRYAALHVGPVASLPLGYRTAGKEIAAISTKAHKQSLRMRAENPYESGLEAIASKASTSLETRSKDNALEDASKSNRRKNPRLPPVLWQKVGIIDVSKLLPSENFPRVDLQTYSHEDVGFQIKIYFILPEEIESENVKMEFLEQAFEIWAICAKAAYRVFLPKLYKTIIPERSSVKVIAKKRKIIVTMQKYDNYEWRFLKV